ncbi:hypothetical protein DOTSEDRAFT_45730 [Dothistroma septosporum NZE10]|uniref:Uncharacterized protein n=1 Tax=Dothistroma septosporum (strain NZE10 / CBS 128990) TaxID=675120 RepID=N1PHV2_DOTSN|nr:hypothetical protein DOTSEDRAFT_45730 [Dothistroma septosporum NZE10]
MSYHMHVLRCNAWGSSTATSKKTTSNEIARGSTPPPSTCKDAGELSQRTPVRVELADASGDSSTQNPKSNIKAPANHTQQT